MPSQVKTPSPISSSSSPRARSKTRDLRFTVRIKAAPDQVYKALTSATELCRWWLQGAETDARSSGRFRMVWPKLKRKHGPGPAARVFPPNVCLGDSEGYFVDLQPGQKVAWMWKVGRGTKYPALSTFFIEKNRSRGCDVTLLHGGFSSKPEADRYFEGCAQGWEDCLAKLKLYLETGRTCRSQALTFASLDELLKQSKRG
jgi:uncharacterized protein YndB with AHSA1/START domain